MTKEEEKNEYWVTVINPYYLPTFTMQKNREQKLKYGGSNRAEIKTTGSCEIRC